MVNIEGKVKFTVLILKKKPRRKKIYCLSEKKLFLLECILLKKVFLYSQLKLFFTNALWNYITQKKQCLQQKVEDFLHKEKRFSLKLSFKFPSNCEIFKGNTECFSISTLITCKCVVTFRATIYITFLSNYKNVCICLKKT